MRNTDNNINDMCMSTSEKMMNDMSLFLLPTNNPSYSLLYAPLADSIMLVDKFEIFRLQKAISNPTEADTESLEVIKTLTDVVPIHEREGIVKNVSDFLNISILPNNICNFSCSYCYSANGRDSRQINIEELKNVVDFFFSESRNSSPNLTVSIFGGGEPLLSWKNIVLPIVQYIDSITKEQNRTVRITIITNGSVVPEYFAEICLKYNIDLVFSFEILKDIQNLQRKHFNQVHQNLIKLISQGIVPAINSVITELNITRQTEMIETLHSNYPKIKYASFEPVLNTAINNKSLFYKTFSLEFIKARNLALQYGINLTCSVLRNVDVTVDRYCAGEFAVCADGSISVCPCVSSPLDPEYYNYVYGKTTKQGVEIDEQRLHYMLSDNVNSQTLCKYCFAKWNCGGGCINERIRNNGQQRNEYCQFVRNFLKYTLANRLDVIYKKDFNESITNYIGNYENFITE